MARVPSSHTNPPYRDLTTQSRAEAAVALPCVSREPPLAVRGAHDTAQWSSQTRPMHCRSSPSARPHQRHHPHRAWSCCSHRHRGPSAAAAPGRTCPNAYYLPAANRSSPPPPRPWTADVPPTPPPLPSPSPPFLHRVPPTRGPTTMTAPAFVGGLAAAPVVARRGSSRADLCRAPAAPAAARRRALRMEGGGNGGAGGEGAAAGGGGESAEARRERFRVRGAGAVRGMKRGGGWGRLGRRG